jgi:hypothetical protein
MSETPNAGSRAEFEVSNWHSHSKNTFAGFSQPLPSLRDDTARVQLSHEE